MRALITGATGFIGGRLAALLEQPAVLSRDAPRAGRTLGNVRAFSWEPHAEQPPPEAFRDAEGQPVDVVFHLAGDPVAAGRWNDAKKERIRESRVAGTRNLVAGLEALASRPRVLVSASAVGYYGSRGDEVLDETAAAGSDFLAEVCRAWEAEALAAEALGLRVVRLRLGVALAADGGALARMLPPFRAFVGGPLGSGRQWMSWIHRDDVTGLVAAALASDAWVGAVNATSPQPVPNRDFAQALGHALARPSWLRTPAAVLRLRLGEMADMLLTGQRVLPRVAERLGYQYRYRDLGPALRASVRR